MHDAHRRIKKVEKQLKVGSKPEWHAVVVLLPTPEEIAADIPEEQAIADAGELAADDRESARRHRTLA